MLKCSYIDFWRIVRWALQFQGILQFRMSGCVFSLSYFRQEKHSNMLMTMFPIKHVHLGIPITPKNVWRVCGSGLVFIRIPLAIKKIWSKTYPWLRTISLSWAHTYVILRNFSPNIPLIREIFRKFNLAPKRQFLGVFMKKKPLW